MTLLSNTGGLFPAVVWVTVMSVYYIKVQLRGQLCLFQCVKCTVACVYAYFLLHRLLSVLNALVRVLKLNGLFGQTVIHQLSYNILNVTKILWQCPVWCHCLLRLRDSPRFLFNFFFTCIADRVLLSGTLMKIVDG